MNRAVETTDKETQMNRSIIYVLIVAAILGFLYLLLTPFVPEVVKEEEKAGKEATKVLEPNKAVMPPEGQPIQLEQ